MPDIPKQNTSSPSTKWCWKKVIIADGSAPAGDTARAKRGPLHLRSRDAQTPLTITVRYRGGAEASWLISFRGVTRRFPGHLAVHDVLSQLSEAGWY